MMVPKLKLRGEIPDFKRCCCCFPLRYGLLVWSYIKIALEAILIPIMIYYLLLTIMFMSLYLKKGDLLEAIVDLSIFILTLTSVLTDCIATIVFIIGGHKKNVKLLRGFYFYSIAMLIMTVLLILSAVSATLGFWISYHLTLSSWRTAMAVYAFCSVIIVSQIYFLLLLKSEINKLRVNVGEFRFVNNAAEAEGAMEYVEPVMEPVVELVMESVVEQVKLTDTEDV